MGNLQNSVLNRLTQNEIQSAVISFYTSNTGKQSYVKYGSMDLNALEGDYSTIGTTNATSWSLNVVSASISDIDLPIEDFMVTNFDPMLPYIYIPTKHWTAYQDYLTQKYDSNIECDSFKGSCKFIYPCNEIDKSSTNFDFKIAVNDVYGNDGIVSVNIYEILKDGEQFGDEGTCYIPIFSNNLRDQNEFSIGSVFFELNYVVFDASPSL
jgi:hypothetical protein